MNHTAFLRTRGLARALLLALLVPLSVQAQSAPGPWAAEAGSPLYVIPIQGDIEPSTAVFVQRRVNSALAAGADTLVFTIDTFGGRVDSALRIAAVIGSVREARTVAFVGGGEGSLGVSWSAGALIALSCSEIYMAPGTSIGAAAPVIASPEGTMESAGEKTVSAVRSQMASLAEKNGHPAGIALAMVDADVELVEMIVDGKPAAMTAEDAAALERERPGSVTRGRILCAKGKLLSLTAGEAERYGLSAGTADGIEKLAVALGGAADWVFLEPSWADDVVVFLSSAAIQSILILVGLIALFIEINSPGFGVPGTVAIIAFVVLFGSNMLMGMVGSVEIILFLVGMGLLVVEIFVLPGFGIAGVSGLVLIAGALVLSMQDFILPSSEYQWDILARNAATVGAGVLLGIVGIGALIIASPKLRLFDRLALKTAITGTASGRPAPVVDDGMPPPPVKHRRGKAPAATDASGMSAPGAASRPESQEDYLGPEIGDEGRAESVLRPVGRAVFNGRSVSVEAEGRFVDAGTPLRVRAIEGGVIYVEEIGSKE